MATTFIEAAEKYFVGNAQMLKQLEMIENSLRDNAKIVITEARYQPDPVAGKSACRGIQLASQHHQRKRIQVNVN